MSEPRGGSSARGRAGRLVAEFLVIVTGVLVALAVDQWREDQEDRRLAAFYLGALEDDLRQDSISIGRTVGLAQEVLRATGTVDDYVNSRDLPPDFMAFSRDLTWVLMSFRVQDNGATFEDVTSSGNLRLIRNPELRRRLLVYTAAVRAFAQGVDDDGRDVIRSNLPPAFLDSPMFEELRWRVGNAGPDRLLPVAEILEVLRQDANATSEWLRRRQLHAAYVAGDLTWLLENRTWPMLADIRDERAGEPLGSWIGAIPN